LASPERSSPLDPREDRGPHAPPAPPPAVTRRADVDAYLTHLTRFGVKLGLDTIARLLAALGDPQEAFPSIHVAGTNGKGSTVAMLDALLGALGLRVGRYTSPHLSDFSERITVGGRPVGDPDLVRLTAAVVAAARGFDPPPTFFEAATALAFARFGGFGGRRPGGLRPVDAAVVEVGMGGRFDATNVLTPRVSVITNVSLEHTAHLGSTVAAVAGEKAGIVKPGVPVVTGAGGEALDVVRRRAAELGAPLYVLGEDFALAGRGPYTYRGLSARYEGLAPGLAGPHQVANAALALAALELFRAEEGPAPADAVRRALAGVRWPGRLETVGERPWVVLDCAHNAAAAGVLARHLAVTAPEAPLWLVLGVLGDRDFAAFLEPLAPLAHRLFLAAPDSPRRGDPHAQAAVAARLGLAARTFDTVAGAVDAAVGEAAPDGRVCVAGSIYTVGEARAHLRAADRAA
jgi:dihydrofolate synthase/folylpolyglutamate synthase